MSRLFPPSTQSYLFAGSSGQMPVVWPSLGRAGLGKKPAQALGAGQVENSGVLGIQNKVQKAGGSGLRYPGSKWVCAHLQGFLLGLVVSSPIGEECGYMRARAGPSNVGEGISLFCIYRWYSLAVCHIAKKIQLYSTLKTSGDSINSVGIFEKDPYTNHSRHYQTSWSHPPSSLPQVPQEPTKRFLYCEQSGFNLSPPAKQKPCLAGCYQVLLLLPCSISYYLLK